MIASKTAVLIATLDRPAGLDALLGGLARTLLRAEPDGRITVIVVDNSASAGARARCDGASGGRLDLIYRHEPRRGLSFARNAALDAALAIGATHAAFIDDDEVPDPLWLEALLDAMETTGATAAIGPVFPVFDGVPPLWCVERAAHAKVGCVAAGAPLSDGYTSNAIVDLRFVADHGLRFAARYNHTGGEDTAFFRDLRAKGGTIAWAAAAVVHEHIPRGRMSRRWLVRRWFRTGGTEADLAGPGSGGSGRPFHNAARGCARILGGLAILAVGLVRGRGGPGSSLDGLRTICRGAGLIWSVTGRTYAEYGKVGKAVAPP